MISTPVTWELSAVIRELRRKGRPLRLVENGAPQVLPLSPPPGGLLVSFAPTFKRSTTTYSQISRAPVCQKRKKTVVEARSPSHGASFKRNTNLYADAIL